MARPSTAAGHLRNAALYRQQAAFATTIEARLKALNLHLHFMSRARDVNQARDALTCR